MKLLQNGLFWCHKWFGLSFYLDQNIIFQCQTRFNQTVLQSYLDAIRQHELNFVGKINFYNNGNCLHKKTHFKFKI